MMSWARNGKSILASANTFSRFQSIVEDYDELDIGTKSAVLKASSSVVSLITRIGERLLFIGSGTVIECDHLDGYFCATILTSATLLQGSSGENSIPCNLKVDVYLSDGKLKEGEVLAYDFHYNVATIKVKSSTPLNAAAIRDINDTMTIGSEKSALVACTSSPRFSLQPGELVIALGRYCLEPHEIMAAPGVFSARDCLRDCKELLLTSCTVTKVAIGGPLINHYGEVIGVNFFNCPLDAFLPINIALKCLEDLKNNRKVPRPWIGVGVASLYTAPLDKLDWLNQKFPHIFGGIIVEQLIGNGRISSSMERTKVPHWTCWSARNWLKAKVIDQKIKKNKRNKLITMQIREEREKRINKSRKRKLKVKESPASLAGILVGDIIVTCDGNTVGSHLELTEALWEKPGKVVELTMVRPGIGELSLSVEVGSSPKLNRWPIPKTNFRFDLVKQLAVERKDSDNVHA